MFVRKAVTLAVASAAALMGNMAYAQTSQTECILHWVESTYPISLYTTSGSRCKLPIFLRRWRDGLGCGGAEGS